ncbi:MAG: hypothetical protein QOE16_378 [Microbacteriaceae bacterium]|jgi:hypothetical protein|nr:hypothetical protein [Microbacteriaceae bacterium]
MALLYRAKLRPSKVELLESWIPHQPWFAGSVTAGIKNVASFRFDDPAGEVGIETLLVRAGDGPILQVPVTYRGAPLDDAESRLIGTMEHSVLGTRWTYDALGDPAYLQAVVHAVTTGGREADELVDVAGTLTPREPTAAVRGSGTGSWVTPELSVSMISIQDAPGETVASVGGLNVVVYRKPGLGSARSVRRESVHRSESEVLTGTWTNQPISHTLVRVDRK